MRPTGSRRLPGWLLLLFVATLALGTDEFVISGVLPAVAADLGVSSGSAGLWVTAFAAAFALGSPVIAFATDRLNKKAVLVGGLLVFAAANAVIATVDSLGVGVGLRVLAGLAAAAVSPTVMAMAGGAAPEGRSGRYLAVATGGLTVALFTGVPIGTAVAAAYSWRATFVLIAAVGALVGLLCLAMAPSVPGQQPTGLVARLSPLRSAPTLALVLVLFLCGVGGLMFYSYLGTIVDQLGGSPGQVTGVLLLVGVVGFAAVFLGGALADGKGPRVGRLVVVGGHAVAMLAVAVFLAAGGGIGIGLLVLIAAWSLFAWSLSPVIQAGIIAVEPRHAVLALALGISGLYGGSALGAVIGGRLIDHGGPGAVPLVAAAFLAAAWAVALLPGRAAPIPVPDTADTVPAHAPASRAPANVRGKQERARERD